MLVKPAVSRYTKFQLLLLRSKLTILILIPLFSFLLFYHEFIIVVIQLVCVISVEWMPKGALR